MEKEKHVNTKEDIEFLRKFKLFVMTTGLIVGITALARCSYDERIKNNTSIDEDGQFIKKPVGEIMTNDFTEEENFLVLKRTI